MSLSMSKDKTKGSQATSTLQKIAAVLATLPEDDYDINKEFYRIPVEEIEKTVRDNTVVTPPPDRKVFSADVFLSLHNDILVELDKLKNDLGGSPHFNSQTPTLNDEDSSKSFLGIPLSAVKDFSVSPRKYLLRSNNNVFNDCLSFILMLVHLPTKIKLPLILVN